MKKRQNDPVNRHSSTSKRLKNGTGRFNQVPNQFSALESENDLDYEPLEPAKGEKVVLVESDEEEDEKEVEAGEQDNDEILVVSDGDNTEVANNEGDLVLDIEDDDNKEGDEENSSNDNNRTFNELSKQEDFIEFGFSLSEDELDRDLGEYLDDGVLSNDDGDSHRPGYTSSHYPWIKDHDHLKQKEIADWLTHEIKDFVNYISPLKAEIMTRNQVVSQLKANIGKYWPETETHVFGLCATDLYLPGLDIDMVVVSQTGDYENRQKLYQLLSFLRNKRLAQNIEVIAKAKVPIIKFIDPQLQIHIDISFERTNGIVAARKIRKWLALTPGLRELVLVVKQFLRSRKLNNVHVGGLGGYATIIICYSFLKLHPRVSTNNMSVIDNLGSLLIEFFELYGRNFLYDDLVILIEPETEQPRYLLKYKEPHLNTLKNPFAIVIQDPSDDTNNITRSLYNLRDIKKAFGGAFQLLVDKCYQLNSALYKERLGQLILGDIIKYRGEERDFNDDRDKVVNHALILDESDSYEGSGANDKYYFSDMTVESEDDTFAETKDTHEKKTAKKETKEGEKTRRKRAAELMSVGDENEGEDEEEHDKKKQEPNQTAKETTPVSLPKKPKTNLHKEVRRGYWLQKGLEPQ